VEGQTNQPNSRGDDGQNGANTGAHPGAAAASASSQSHSAVDPSVVPGGEYHHDMAPESDGEALDREFSHKDLKRAAKAVRKMSDADLVDVAHKARQWDFHGGDMAKLRADADRNLDLARRAQAEFDNFQKRTERQRREDARYANVPLVRDLLPSIDNLQRAVDAANRTKDVEALTTGVSMTLGGLERALIEHGLIAIDAKGQPFDPELHEAVMTGNDSTVENGIVLDCYERGWKLHERVIRPAKVRVNQLS